MDGAVKLLKELLTIRSVNGRDDEGAVAEYLCKYFEQSGISAHIQRIDATHANVLAELEGESDGAPIFWNGHLDTVPYGEWKTDPAVPVERDGFLYARGASDMKSGLAAMVYALCEYKKSGRPVPHTIHFLGTCDEEKGGIGAVKNAETQTAAVRTAEEIANAEFVSTMNADLAEAAFTSGCTATKHPILLW